MLDYFNGTKTSIGFFKVPKDASLNSPYYFIMKILNKGKLQHSSDIHFKDLINIYKKKCKSNINKDTNILQANNTLPSNRKQMIEQKKFK